jgi:hypothetical protein
MRFVLSSVLAVFSIIALSALSVCEASGFWRLETTKTGWRFVPPSGVDGTVCKYVAVSAIDPNSYRGPTMIGAGLKYEDASAWSSAQNDRLQAWGFNAAGMYSYFYSAHFPSGGVPFAPTDMSSGWLMRDDMEWHVKNVYRNPNPGGAQICSADDYFGTQPDVYDPRLEKSYVEALNKYSWLKNGSASSAIVWFPEEADDMFGLDQEGSHTDLGYMVASQTPIYVDDQQSYKYRPGEMQLYSKAALRDFLRNRYGTINALNVAWELKSSEHCDSSNPAKVCNDGYTTWDTSNPGGWSSITGNQPLYESWGRGTGFLDENGKRLLPLKDHNCDHRSIVAWSRTPKIEADLHDFIREFARHYAEALSTAVNEAIPDHPPMFLPLYNPPSYVSSAVSPYVAGFWIQNLYPGQVQRILLNDGNKPVIVVDYALANADSPLKESKHPPDVNFWSNQAARGNGMVAGWQKELGLRNADPRCPGGCYAVVGLEHWQLYDNSNEGNAFGLVTNTHDNPYDGSANMVNGEPSNFGDALAPITWFLKGHSSWLDSKGMQRRGICDP